MSKGQGGPQPICSWEKEVTESPGQRRVLARPSRMPGPLGCSWATPGELAVRLRSFKLQLGYPWRTSSEAEVL